MFRRRIVSVVLAALLVTVGVGQAIAQPSCAGSNPGLCPLGEPVGADCRIDVECTVASSAPYTPLAFGSRRLVVAEKITVTGDGILQVAAGAVAIESSGEIQAVGTPDGRQRITLVATGDVTVASGGQIDVSSSVTTVLYPSIELAGAAIRIDGALRASGIGRKTYGGSVTVEASGDVRVAEVDVSGGEEGGGGYADFYAADGSITVLAPVRAQGLDGGSVLFDAGGDVIIHAPLQVQATGPDGYGGTVEAYAAGSVTIGGEISGKGREGEHSGGPADSGGDGAYVTIEATDGSVVVDANIDLSGAPSGYAGDFVATAGLDATIRGKILLGTDGVDGSGSSGSEIVAGRDLIISRDIDASSPGTGGDLTFAAGRRLAVLAPARIRVDGSADPDSFGGAGSIVLESDCALELAAGTVLSATGIGDYPYASNELRAASLTIAGTVQAGSENWIEYGTVTVQPTANLIPDVPLPGPSPAAPCCDSCPTTTTTSTLPPTTTTTTTLPPTTTTSTLAPPTTTTLPPTPTTTTLPPTTTTTTLPATTTSSTTTTSIRPATSTTVTTTTLEPTTSTSSTTVTAPTAISSTTIAASTTTTTGEPAPTTSTTAPPPGSECANAVDVAPCLVDALASTLAVSSIDELGGKATARRLKALAGRADKLLDSAASGARVKVNLRKARRDLRSVERTVRQGLRRKRSTIDVVLGGVILGLAHDATNDVEVMQARIR